MFLEVKDRPIQSHTLPRLVDDCEGQRLFRIGGAAALLRRATEISGYAPADVVEAWRVVIRWNDCA